MHLPGLLKDLYTPTPAPAPPACYRPTDELLEAMRLWPIRSMDSWVWTSGQPVLVLMLPELRVMDKTTNAITALNATDDASFQLAMQGMGWAPVA